MNTYDYVNSMCYFVSIQHASLQSIEPILAYASLICSLCVLLILNSA